MVLFLLCSSISFLFQNVNRLRSKNSDLFKAVILNDINIIDLMDMTLLPMGITTDLESDLIEGMFCCNLGQINSIPNQNGTFLDLIFSNPSTDITVEICVSLFLGLDHHRAYELLVDVQLCKFEATSIDEKRFRFRAADSEAITDELGLVG
jgi:hypothetical protein